MFGLDQIQHADVWLKAAPNSHAIAFHRDAGGKAVCEVFDGSSVNSQGEGDSLQDALKDALTKAGLNHG